MTPTGEAVQVKIPFSTSDLNSCAEEVRNYNEDPSTAAKGLSYVGGNEAEAGQKYQRKFKPATD